MPLSTCNHCNNNLPSCQSAPTLFSQEIIDLKTTTHASFSDIQIPNDNMWIEFYLYTRESLPGLTDSTKWTNIMHFGPNMAPDNVWNDPYMPNNAFRQPSIWASYYNNGNIKITVSWSQNGYSNSLNFFNNPATCSSYHFVIKLTSTYMQVTLNGVTKTGNFNTLYNPIDYGAYPGPFTPSITSNSRPFRAPFMHPPTGGVYATEPFNAVIKGLRVMDEECVDCGCTIEGNEYDSNDGYLVHPSTRAECPILYRECLSNPCQNNGTCTDSADYLSYTCDCIWDGPDKLYTGVNCETHVPAPCASTPCQNNGTCENINNFSDFECDCPLGWIQKACTQYFPCELNPCQNGASCQNVIDTNNTDVFLYECSCNAGYAGVDCELDIPCFSDPCRNSGTCSNSADYLNYTCSCLEFYEGENCDIITPCQAAPCKNGGICSNTQDLQSYSCDCGSDFTGSTCEIPAPCNNSPCENDGVCVNSQDLSSYTCNCTDAYTGTDCDLPIPCYSSPCKNGGVCENSETFLTYTCSCPSGIIGNDCQIIIP